MIQSFTAGVARVSTCLLIAFRCVLPVFRFSFTHKSVSSNIDNPAITFCFRHKDGSDSPRSDEDDSFERSFLPTSQEETQVHPNKNTKRHSSGKPHKRHKHHSKNHSHSHRRVLSDVAAQNRHNRRLEFEWTQALH